MHRETGSGRLIWIGMKAFLDTWTPQCNHGAIIENGDMTVHEDGRISYRARKPYLPARYRVIEETPHYVVTLVQDPPSKDGTFDLRFWAFRPLGESRPQGSTDMNPIAINECRVCGDDARKQAIWTLSDAELVDFWKTNKFCHPSLTKKEEFINPYWGARWGQACYYAR